MVAFGWVEFETPIKKENTGKFQWLMECGVVVETAGPPFEKDRSSYLPPWMCFASMWKIISRWRFENL